MVNTKCRIFTGIIQNISRVIVEILKNGIFIREYSNILDSTPLLPDLGLFNRKYCKKNIKRSISYLSLNLAIFSI